MALQKTIKKENGVQVSYHRIAMIKVDLNQQITLLVESYVDEEGRNYEKKYAEGKISGEPTFPYTDGDYIHIDYDESLSMLKGELIKEAYDWLKQQPDYVGSVDI